MPSWEDATALCHILRHLRCSSSASVALIIYSLNLFNLIAVKQQKYKKVFNSQILIKCESFQKGCTVKWRIFPYDFFT